MKWFASWMVALALAQSLMADTEKRSVPAVAEWLSSRLSVQPGEVLRTVIRLKVEPDWHVYWVNPGDAGMPTSVEWQLPDGWSTDGLQHPIPERFTTGELHGFGYTGTVDYPVEITVPEDFTGQATLRGRVSWLSCNEQSCVPGSKLVEITVGAGEGFESNPHQAVIDSAFSRLPVSSPEGVDMQVADHGDVWRFSLVGAEAINFDVSTATLFVETAEVVAPSVQFSFRKRGSGWSVDLPKSPYAADQLAECSIILVPQGDKRALRLKWKAP